MSAAAVVALLVLGCMSDRVVSAPESPNPPAPNATGVDPTAPILVAAGDIGSCTEYDTATGRLLDTISGTVAPLGDNAYPNGSPGDYANCYDPMWGRQKARTRPVVGNHEYNTPGASGYWQYFGRVGGDSGKFYYSYDIGTWHIVVLNSNFVESSALAQQIPVDTEVAWLKADLAAHPSKCTVAMWHHPRFSSGTVHGSNAAFQPFWQALYDAGADIVLVAHEHNYERFAPQTPDGRSDVNYGIRQFVAGTGSDASDPFGTPAPNSEVRSLTPGVLKLTLDPGGYTWKFVSIPTRTFSDSGSAPCHDPPPPQPPTASAGGPYSTNDGTVHFDGSGSTEQNGTIVGYNWSFGDGNTNNDGPKPTHTYTADGTFTASLTVTDSRGVTANTTTSVSVTRTNTAVTLSGAGNIAACGYGQAEKTAQILDTLPGFVFAAGDNVIPGGASNYSSCYQPTWGRHKTRTFPTPGNHEYDSSTTAAGYFGYFGNRAGAAGQGYYSVDLGAWHVVVLNDQIPFASGSPQEQWLKADLAATSRKCILALWHIPLFLSSSTAGYYTNDDHKVIWDDLYAAHADVVINGNQHDYERMAPMRPDGTADDSTGIRQFNAGTGGESSSMPTVVHPNSKALSANFGVLRFTLRSTGYDWQFIPIAGQTFSDAGSGGCHGAGSPPPPPPPPPPTNNPPTANPGGPYRAEGVVQFDGSGSSDPDGDTPLTYAWNFGDGSTGSGAKPTHTYASFGSYTVTLTVTDSRGLAGAPAQTTATIANEPPSVRITSGSSSSILGYTLTALFSDPGNDGPYSWRVDWGDVLGTSTSGSTSGNGISASHTYLVPGTYQVRVSVTDANGGTGTASVLLTVRVT